MMLAFAALLAAQAAAPDNWQMGGGRTWTNPPGPYCKYHEVQCALEESNEQARTRFRDMEALAQKGDIKAMRVVGVMLVHGDGVKGDPSAGLGWLYEAAIRGDRFSMRALGEAFEKGIGVAPDPTLARVWFDRAER